MREIELKFEIDPEQGRALRRLPLLAALRPQRIRQLTIYFDTPDFALSERSMALRLRRQGGRWVQSLKAGQSGSAGLHARDEWEIPQKGPVLDLSAFAGTPLGDLHEGARLHERLAEAFRVEGTRTRWVVPLASGRVEVDFDEAVLRCGERGEAICEVEIESLDGDPQAVFEVAESLLEAVALRPIATTKAERGYRLLRGDRSRPEKARCVALDQAMGVEEAARATLAAALAQVQANEAGALRSPDPEYVHQMRVGLRRLRSAIRTFGDVIGPEVRDGTREDLRWIGRSSGKARDWDVLALETFPPLASAYGDKAAVRSLIGRIGAERRKAREALREDLRSQRHARLLLVFARWLAAESAPAPGSPSLPEFAARVLRKRHKRLKAGAERLAVLTPEERHRLRIQAKRLRYALDGFASVFKGKPHDAYREALMEVQDDLGRANDAATAERLIGSLEPPEALRQFAHGWLAAQTHTSVYRLGRHFRALGGRPRFWKRFLPRPDPGA